MNELVADELQAFAALMLGVRNLGEEQLNDPELLHRIKHTTLDHYRQHGSDIRKHFNQPLRQI